MAFRTQKARGIAVLRQIPLTPPWGLCAASHAYIGDEQDLATWAEDYVNRFARPCPTRPRHGFVESRHVQSYAELRAVWEQARAADPEAELLLGPVFREICGSAVLTGDRLAVGPGNDAATGGHDVIELGVVPWRPPAEIAAQAGISGTAYVEAIFPQDRGGLLVQLRDGPKLPTTRNYIPQKTRVFAVVRPSDDLLAWEQIVTTLPPGTVVWAPGGSLASHAAVHCVLNEVPYVTDAEPPAIGSTLRPTRSRAAAFNASEFRAGVDWIMRRLAQTAAYSEGRAQTMRACVTLALAVLHNWAALVCWPIASRLLGAAAAGLSVLGAAICAGEARHYSISRRQQRHAAAERDAVYHAALSAPPEELMRGFVEAHWAFGQDGWTRGYGGARWAACAEALVDLWERTRAVTVAPSAAAARRLVAALNRAVNAAHNNGKLFGKVSPAHTFDAAAAEPCWPMLASTPMILQCAAWSVEEGLVLPALESYVPPPADISEPAPEEDSESESEEDSESESEEDSESESEPHQAQVRLFSTNGVKVQFWLPGCHHRSHTYFGIDLARLQRLQQAIFAAQAVGALAQSRANSAELYLPLATVSGVDRGTVLAAIDTVIDAALPKDVTA